MTRLLWSLACGIALLLVATLGVEYQDRPSEDPALNLSLRRTPPTPRAGSTGLVETTPANAAVGAEQDRDRQRAATLLARPLFSPERRPVAEPKARPAAPPRLPRLAGILISEAGRLAIFADPAGGKPVVAGEGGMVGAFRIRSIGAGEVVVAGPDGTSRLRPSYAPVSGGSASGASPAATPAAPSLDPATGKPSILEQLLGRGPVSAGVPGLTAPPAAPAPGR